MRATRALHPNPATHLTVYGADRSTKSFLRRYASGLLPPATGSPDSQANAFARLPPLVALLAGAARQDLLTAVACMIRWGRSPCKPACHPAKLAASARACSDGEGICGHAAIPRPASLI